MKPTLIGYFPKRTVTRPDWLKAEGVEEICSVSPCLSQGPEDWIEEWKHNELWVYDSPDMAWSVVPEYLKHEFDLYAYMLFPLIVREGRRGPFALPLVNATRMGDDFRSLGFDAVSRTLGDGFECSPLSCNHFAEHYPANRHCLLDDFTAALELAIQFDLARPGRGPYHVLEVFRQLRQH